jgi:hypothetical protein
VASNPQALDPKKRQTGRIASQLPLDYCHPTLATIAVIISGIAIINNQHALKISQRAYIDARFSIDHQTDYPSIWMLNVEFDNTGNTPATIFKIIPQAIARLQPSVGESFLQMNDSLPQRLISSWKTIRQQS